MRAGPHDRVNAAMELAVAHGEDLLARVAVGVEYAIAVGYRQLLAVRLDGNDEFFGEQAAVAGSEFEVCGGALEVNNEFSVSFLGGVNHQGRGR